MYALGNLTLLFHTDGYGLYRYDSLDPINIVGGPGYFNNIDDNLNLIVGDIILGFTWLSAIRSGTITEATPLIVSDVILGVVETAEVWITTEITDPTLTLDYNFLLNSGSIISQATRKGPVPTFTRASSGTNFDENGILVTAATNAPRFDHNPVTNSPLGLLREEAGTNVCLQSEDFSTTWATTRASITTNDIAAPDGNTTADKLVEDNTASSSHFVNQSFSGLTDDTVYAFSVFVRADERSAIAIQIRSKATTFTSGFFNLSTVVASGSTDTATIEDVGGGWFRCTVTEDVENGGTTPQMQIFLQGPGSSYSGDGSSGLHLWGAQVEADIFPTSYIVTTTASVTRSADVCSTTDLSWLNADMGTFLIEGDFTNDASDGITRFMFQIDDGTNNNRILINRQVTDAMAGFVIDGGATQASINSPPDIAAGVSTRGALAYKANDFAISKDGAGPTLDTSGTVPTGLTTLRVGSSLSANVEINGHIAQIQYWNVRKSNSFLTSETL